jgi:hypothetical protein
MLFGTHVILFVRLKLCDRSHVSLWQKFSVIVFGHFTCIDKWINAYVSLHTWLLYTSEAFPIGTPRFFLGGGDVVGQTLGLYIIYVWFWILFYEIYTKYSSWYLVRLQEKLKVTKQIDIGYIYKFLLYVSVLYCTLGWGVNRVKLRCHPVYKTRVI